MTERELFKLQSAVEDEVIQCIRNVFQLVRTAMFHSDLSTSAQGETAHSPLYGHSIPQNSHFPSGEYERKSQYTDVSSSPVERKSQYTDVSSSPVERKSNTTDVSSTPVERKPQTTDVSSTPVERKPKTTDVSSTPIEGKSKTTDVSSTPVEGKFQNASQYYHTAPRHIEEYGGTFSPYPSYGEYDEDDSELPPQRLSWLRSAELWQAVSRRNKDGDLRSKVFCERVERVLNIIDHYPGIARSHLIEDSGLSPRTVSNILRLLSRGNLVETREVRGHWYPVKKPAYEIDGAREPY